MVGGEPRPRGLFSPTQVQHVTYTGPQGRHQNCPGVRYTDQRLTSEQFMAVKDKLPFGQLPVAKINGEVIFQSMAIAR